ncbi:hypothetical protein JCM11641_002573, partial [Rhodosporidiobolus odoratus]
PTQLEASPLQLPSPLLSPLSGSSRPTSSHPDAPSLLIYLTLTRPSPSSLSKIAASLSARPRLSFRSDQ